MRTPKNDSTATRLAVLETLADVTKDSLQRLENLLCRNVQEVNERLDKIDNKFEKIDHRFIALMDNIDHRFDKVDKKLESLDKKLDLKLDKINNRFWVQFFWATGGFAAVLTVIAKAVHWI